MKNEATNVETLETGTVDSTVISQGSVNHVSEDETTVKVRFARETGTNPKAPIGAYYLTLPGPLAGLTLKGQLFKDQKDGSITVSIPGGRNFGGIFGAELETATINGRIIAVSGSFDENGMRKMKTFEPVILTAWHAFVTNPQKNAVQRVSF